MIEDSEHPEYRLIQSIPSSHPCQAHAREKLVDLFNSDTWKCVPVDIDKMKFSCPICSSVRVYMILPEKTTL